jgi:hypothetical protein
MVSMALTLFIMVILSQAFVTALEAFSGMKALGDMQQDLRTAETTIRDDLRQNHLVGKRRPSDLTTRGGSQVNALPVEAGFFATRRGSPYVMVPGASAPYVWEGNDASGMPSNRAVDHVLYMTVNRRGNRQENFFSTSLQGPAPLLTKFFQQITAYNMDPTKSLPFATQAMPYSGGTAATYSSQWAEVVYFLVQTGTTEEPNKVDSTIGTPLFKLYRAQFVMPPDATQLNAALAANANANGLAQTTFAGMSCRGTNFLRFYDPALAAGGARMIPDLAAFDTNDSRIRTGATVLMSNVISFEIQIMKFGDRVFSPENWKILDPDNVVRDYAVFDTIKLPGATGYPQAGFPGLKAVQITLRVWEAKTRQTRQATIVLDL